MLQQDEPEDFVIATGVQASVRDFVQMACHQLGIDIEFRGQGLDEVGVVSSIQQGEATVLKEGDVIVRVDPRYFRPAEVDSLLGDASKARRQLGWEPSISFEELVGEMVEADLELARRDALVKRKGFKVFSRHE